MKPYAIKLDHDEASSLVVNVLQDNLDSLRNDWERVNKDNKGFIWEGDPDLDREIISEHISAIKKIIRYHGGTPK